MNWELYWWIAVSVLAATVLLSLIRSALRGKHLTWLDPLKILFFGVIVSATVLFIPLYINEFEKSGCGGLETFAIAVHNMIRLFVVDGDFAFVTDHLAGAELWYPRYTVLFSVLFVAAPILTFGFAMSFAKNLWAYFRYGFRFFSNAYVFSELNERSIQLAEDLCNNAPWSRFVVFTDVFDKKEERSYELLQRATAIGAICFKKDIASINFRFHAPWKKLVFFTMGENQSENIGQSLSLIRSFKRRRNAHLYVFSTQVEAEMLLSNAFAEAGKDGKPIRIKVRRINEVQSLIQRNLYDTGFESIFNTAYRPTPDADTKQIHAVVVGLGQHGTEMIKALPWFCQMDGYRVQVTAFEKDPLAEEKFRSQCPELMQLEGRFEDDGEAQYGLKIHSGIDVDTVTFDQQVMALDRVTYVFVALGNDEKNIAISLKLRALFEGMGCHPCIQAVVYNTEKKDALDGITNFRGTAYDVQFIGDTKTSCSEKVILNSDVELVALSRHLKWGDETDFWRYNYNYKSSVASAIHRKMKSLCGIPGIDKAKEERSDAELLAIRKLEHRRWNAYMRAEGYCYSGDCKDPATRNDLAKRHHCLVTFGDLLPKEQAKDDD